VVDVGRSKFGFVNLLGEVEEIKLQLARNLIDD